MQISLDHLQALIDAALLTYDQDELAEAKRQLIRAQREIENVDEKIWKLKSQISREQTL
jgi:hypothetical protein